MMAALLARAVPRWRSRQFSETLSLPPTNHLAKGDFQSRTRVHFWFQRSSEASRAQNLSGLSMDSRYISRYWAMLLMRACFTKAGEGLKTRFSMRWDSMFWDMSGV